MKKNVLILRQVPHEPGGTLEIALQKAAVDFRYIDLYQETPDGLPLDEAAGLVVMGGPMNVDQVDRYPFLAKELGWIEQAIDLELPMLGICLGSQLLAKTLGARVYRNRISEIGWYPIELTSTAADDALFGQGGRRTVFQWHGDTFDLPGGAVHLARNDWCENQAFRYGPRAYGLQFHLEMTAELVDDWLAEAGNCRELDQLDYIDPQVIRVQMPVELPRLQTFAAEVFGRFAAMCLGAFQAPNG
jgi:GMP synthase (glutamine-hydrolysing)